MSNILFYFPLFSTFSLCTCLHVSFLGYLKLSGLLLSLLNNPCIVGTQCLFTVNLFIQKFHEKTFLKREPLFTEYLLWARHCAQNFDSLSLWSYLMVKKKKDFPILQLKKLKLREVKSACPRSVWERQAVQRFIPDLKACAPHPFLPFFLLQVHFVREFQMGIW